MASKDKLASFVDKMKEFPCSFNVGSTKSELANNEFDTKGFHEPQLKKNNWSNIKKYLEEDVDELDPDLVDPTWKDNLRVRVYAELGDFDKAWELNKEILEKSPENLVALANSGFLFALEFQFNKGAENILEKLNKRKEAQDFELAKYDAICEQGYTLYKFSEYNKINIQNAITILKQCIDCSHIKDNHRLEHNNELLKLMLACLYRRSDNPALNNDVKKWISKANKRFIFIQESTLNNSVKSICLVELAILNKNGRENKMHVRGDYASNWDLCKEAFTLNPKSKRVLIAAGPMLVDVKNNPQAENMLKILKKIIGTNKEPLAHSYVGGVYFSQAKINEKKPKAKHFLRKTVQENDLMKLLLDLIQKIPVYRRDNEFLYKAIESFKLYLQGNCNDLNHCCKIAFKMFQGQAYDDVCDICQKIVGVARSKLSVCHIDAYFIMSLCCAIKFVSSSDEENFQEIEKKCLDMVVCCLRCATVLLIQEKTKTVDHQLLWQGFLKEPGKFPYHIMDPRIHSFERLQKLVSFFRPALPDLERIIQKTEENWDDVTQIKQELEQLKNTNLNLALLYLSLINLRPETRQRISWRNSHVVRAIKLEAAQDIFTQGKLGVCHDGIWEEIFHEEFQIDPKSKTSPVALLDRLIQGTSCDVFIVENIQSTNDTGNDVIVSQNLKAVLTNICGLNVMRSSDVTDPDERSNVISRSTVLIVVQKQKQKQNNRNETTLNPTPTRSDGNESNVLTQSLEIFAASYKEGTTTRHAIIAVVEDENHEDENHEDENHEDENHEDESHEDENHEDENHEDENHEDESHEDENHEDENHEDENHEDELRIPKELSGHSQLTFTLEEVKVLEEMSSSREDGQVDVLMKVFKTIVRQS